MKKVILIFLVLVFLLGCASLGRTKDEIVKNPEAYKTESMGIANAVTTAFPELPFVACMGIGYAAAFLRRWYKNIKIETNGKKSHGKS